MTKEQLTRLWNEKVVKGIPLSDAEKSSFIDAYWTGNLPDVKNVSVAQWVEDGCITFDYHGLQ